MAKSNSKIFSILFTSSAFTLTGCAGDTVPISQIVKDKKSYLNQNYASTSIPESVLKKLPLESSGEKKKDIKIYFNAHVDGVNGQILDRKLMNTYSILGNGLVQIIEEYSSNDIPNIYRFSISYEAFDDIKWLDALPEEGNTRMPMEIKEITTWSKFNTPGKFTAIYKWGTVMQIANYKDAQTVCETGNKFNAKDLHAKFSGIAFSLECTYSINGVVAYKRHKAFIEDLSLAIPVDTVNSSVKETLTITDVVGL